MKALHNFVIKAVALLLFGHGVAAQKHKTDSPTSPPTFFQIASPTYFQTASPTYGQTASPTYFQTASPTYSQTASPTYFQTASPTYSQTASPTYFQTASPTVPPTVPPTTKDCSPFDPKFIPKFDASSSFCALSMSPMFGLEVGGTVVQIDIGPYNACPLNPDANIFCRFENDDYQTNQITPGTYVSSPSGRQTIECVSPFSGQPKNVNVTYTAIPQGCDIEAARFFELEEQFEYIGHRAGVVVDPSDSFDNKHLFVTDDIIEVEWNSKALALSASRDHISFGLTVNIEVLAYRHLHDSSSDPQFVKIASFNNVPAESNKYSFKLDDEQTLIDKGAFIPWGSYTPNREKVAVILVRVTAEPTGDDSDQKWILATRTSQLIAVIPRNRPLGGNLYSCSNSNNLRANLSCKNEDVYMTCPPTHEIATEDPKYMPDTTCIWPSGNKNCDPRVDLEVDLLVACFNAENTTNSCDDKVFPDEDEYDATDACPCNTFHPGNPGVVGCVTDGAYGGHVRCCYAENGALINEYNDGAGRPQCTPSYVNDPVELWVQDTLPYLFCCFDGLYDDRCESYLNTLTPNLFDDEPYIFPSPPGISFGDPHLINLDLVQYNFNGAGEYVAACGGYGVDDDVARDLCNPNPTAPTENPTSAPTGNLTGTPTGAPTGNPTSTPTTSPIGNLTSSPIFSPTAAPAGRRLQSDNVLTSVNYRFGPFDGAHNGATVNKGVAIQDPTFHGGTKKLIIVPSGVDRMHVYIDGTKIEFPDSTYFRLSFLSSGMKIKVPKNKNRRAFVAEIRFKSGLKIIISAVPGGLNPSITKSAGINNFVGLMGQNDGNQTNDFVLPNGAEVPILTRKNVDNNKFVTAVNDEQIFTDYGQNWAIRQKENSLFDSIKDVDGESFNDFNEPDYEPQFDECFDSVTPTCNDTARNLRKLKSIEEGKDICAGYIGDQFIYRACLFDFNITESLEFVQLSSDFATEQKVIQTMLVNKPPVVRNNGRSQNISVAINEDYAFQIVSFDPDEMDTIAANLTRNDDSLFELYGDASTPGTYGVQFRGSDKGGIFRAHVTLTDGKIPVIVTTTVTVTEPVPTAAPTMLGDDFKHFPDELCLATCVGAGHAEVCTFTFTLNQGASELGYYTVAGCRGIMPVLGMKKDVQYRFVQEDLSNYYHPLGFAYYADGAHDNVDELEPSIDPSGSTTGCSADNTCPAPMYLNSGNYLGVYSNIAEISALKGDEDFGLDVYEPQFFANPVDWSTAGTYEVALKFDHAYTKDIFYFCHIHQYMSGRIKFVDTSGNVISTANDPVIPYAYKQASVYDQSCGAYGITRFQLPNSQCPSKFVCDAPGRVTEFARCIESMNCAMTAGMTTGASSDNAMALFVHQMIPHHQNAVNMAKALLANRVLNSCKNIEDETPECILKVISMEIITQQNHQIQGMYGAVEELKYSATDDCVVEMSKTHKFNIKSKQEPSLCVDITSVAPQRNVVLKACDGSKSQIWRIEQNGRIKNKKTERCITDRKGKVQNKGCLKVVENEVSQGFRDTIVFSNKGVMTPGATTNGEVALTVSPRNEEFIDSIGPDSQEFFFSYLHMSAGNSERLHLNS